MKLLNEHHSFIGMQKDINALKHPPTYLYNAKNIRITSRGDSTLYAITNEKGPSKVDDIELTGTYLGSCKLGKYLIIFTTTKSGDTPDYIYRIDLEAETLTTLKNGNFSFSTPIEAVGDFENEDIQKVYWVDGVNPPRFLNIVAEVTEDSKSENRFDFTPELALRENVEVTKILGSGEFPSGVIQYAFTYFNKYGQESNIFYVTPLYYISYKGRAGSPEDKVANAFKIVLNDLDHNFDYVRIYSILRTSLNGTPIVKRVQDIKCLENEPVGGIPDIEESSMWYYRVMPYGNNYSIEISEDGGETFESIDEYTSDLTYVPYNINNDGVSSKEDYIEWKKSVIDGKNGKAYKFDKSTYENLIIKIDKYYYTWDDAGNTQNIYIGISDAYGGYKILVGETSDDSKRNSDIKKVNTLSFTKRKVAISYIDTGIGGEIMDPTELLYKGGEAFTASTIAIFDNTLFLGDLNIKREEDIQIGKEKKSLQSIFKSLTQASNDSPLIKNYVTSCTYKRHYSKEEGETPYLDTLNPLDIEEQGASMFKSNEYYRLGVQLQHKSGKWSSPCWIGDIQCSKTPTKDEQLGIIYAPGFQFDLNDLSSDNIIKAGYRRIRPIFAVPSISDRTILCQGVICPTLYRKVDRWSDATENSSTNVWTGKSLGNLYAQSSWLFRTPIDNSDFYHLKYEGGGQITFDGDLVSIDDFTGDDLTTAEYERSTEVMGFYDDGHKYYVDKQFITFHSPDVQFDDAFANIDFEGCSMHKVGYTTIRNTYGDISIKTSSPMIGTSAGGFVHKSIKTKGYAALISDVLYEDAVVNDLTATPTYGPYETSYENEINYRWLIHLWHKRGSLNNDVNRTGRSSVLFKKVISNVRFCNDIYYSGNEDVIDLQSNGITLFNSDQISLVKSAGLPYMGNIDTLVIPTSNSRYFMRRMLSTEKNITWVTRMLAKIEDTIGLWKKDTDNKKWVIEDSTIGEHVPNLCKWREGVSIKYKSTPHLVASIGAYAPDVYNEDIPGSLVLAEIRKPYDKNTFLGGTREDAMEAATWIPCGPTVNIDITNSIKLQYKWGDTYFQRFECLKTYPFTKEDENQVVEIASFMVETRVNLGGRYDRNRGQLSALNISPTNFNLINPVYSQLDNFFNYRIIDEDFYKLNSFSNQITWSKPKSAGQEIDSWTNIPMSVTYDLDGSKGSITALKTWMDKLYCFQSKGVSNILFNSRVQIPTSDGVPIEISNSAKLEGHRYITEGYGCSNKQAIRICNSGIYFMDDSTNHLMHIGEGIRDIAVTHSMSSWFDTNSIKSILYDAKYSDIYLVNDDEALCFSELLGQFTSFFDYGGISLLETYKEKVFTLKDNALYKMYTGEYNKFFDNNKPWEFTFITNGTSAKAQDFSKIFSNIDYRLDISENTEYKPDSTLEYIQVEDTYQDTGKCNLVRLKAVNYPKSYHHKDTNLQKKFKTWRIQIPRHNGSLDRITDHWCKITLGNNGNSNQKAILYDLNVQYYV